MVHAGPMRTTVATIGASFAKLWQWPMALISPVTSIRRLRASAGASECTQRDDGGQHQRSSFQSLDHDALPLIATDNSLFGCLSRGASSNIRGGAQPRRETTITCIVSQTQVRSQYAIDLLLRGPALASPKTWMARTSKRNVGKEARKRRAHAFQHRRRCTWASLRPTSYLEVSAINAW